MRFGAGMPPRKAGGRLGPNVSPRAWIRLHYIVVVARAPWRRRTICPVDCKWIQERLSFPRRDAETQRNAEKRQRKCVLCASSACSAPPRGEDGRTLRHSIPTSPVVVLFDACRRWPRLFAGAPFRDLFGQPNHLAAERLGHGGFQPGGDRVSGPLTRGRHSVVMVKHCLRPLMSPVPWYVERRTRQLLLENTRTIPDFIECRARSLYWPARVMITLAEEIQRK